MRLIADCSQMQQGNQALRDARVPDKTVEDLAAYHMKVGVNTATTSARCCLARWSSLTV